MPGPLIGDSSSAVSGTTITTIRRILAPRVGAYSLVATTSTPGGPDGLRTVIATRLRDPANRPEKYDHRYAYITSGDNTGFSSRIFPGGFDGVLGSVLLSVPFAAELATGSSVELSAWPAIADGDLLGLNDDIRTALMNLTLVQALGVVAVDRQVRYSVAAFGWVLRSDDVVGVYPSIPSGQTAAQTWPRPIARGSWDLEYDGEAPYLLVSAPAAAGETFYVRVKRPAGTWIKSGGVWGASTVGPADETAGTDPDEVAYDAQTVASVALPITLQRLIDHHRSLGDDALVARYTDRLAKAEARGAATRWFRGIRGTGRQVVGARSGRSSIWGSKQ